jgi:hypothetical protein
MATSYRKLCVKCGKSGGVFTCDGCQESFCGQHTAVHRQELAYRLDNLGQEHDLLRRDLINNNEQDSMFTRIDVWETESIMKIKLAAEKARADLRQFREQLKISCSQISDELRAAHESDSYSEIDLNRWMKNLQLLRNELETPTHIDIVQHESKDSISLIKIDQIDNIHLTLADHERFDEIAGSVILSKNRLTATIFDPMGSVSSASIRGETFYSSGSHKIYFEIVNKKQDYLFFGVMSSIQKLSTDAFSLSSTNGWWDVGYLVIEGHSLNHYPGNIIKTGDRIVLTLDCDHEEISYTIKRTGQNETLKVYLDSCPFPWNFLISMDSSGDSVRLLSEKSF